MKKSEALKLFEGARVRLKTRLPEDYRELAGREVFVTRVYGTVGRIRIFGSDKVITPGMIAEQLPGRVIVRSGRY